MSREKQIEVVTYERERLDYFTELMQLARTRYNLLYHKFKDAPYVSEEHQMLSDMGREVQFFGDVVEMLENGYRKQSEGEWVSVDERLPETEGYYLVWNKEQRKIEIRFFYRLPPHYPVETYPEIREYFGDCSDHKRITHWMPLPEPPKGD